ncbi:PREDICTED: uncharacterized protein LOC106549901 [Thamnophis sirtalis]|uniref:Uncharacterized protein LOC106549901 n=1 Tax=Thamnophis sirtalis TaxID=35019 RepID=A0A6I9YFU4_9SAUR|nr:PREDICTED: uncharacterized protein LOC106549901 [Thamnophis sirtalis]
MYDRRLYCHLQTPVGGGKTDKYQTILLDSPAIQLEVCNTLNPDTLLPQVDTEFDQPLPNADCEWFTDGSGFMMEGLRKAGYAVVIVWEVIEAKPLPVNTSAQLAELVALTRALQLAAGLTVNTQIANMPLEFCTPTELYGRKEDY